MRAKNGVIKSQHQATSEMYATLLSQESSKTSYIDDLVNTSDAAQREKIETC